MLISFEVENFLSFKERISFSTLASREAQHRNRLQNFRGAHILPTAAIYGGNGGGKSNLMYALKFARHLIVSGTSADDAIERRPFKLDPECSKHPSLFCFEILTAGEKLYRYEFSVTSQTIQSEQLTEIRPSSERVVFGRESKDDEDRWSFKHFDNRSHFSEEDGQFVRFVAKGTRKNQLFLREAIDRNLEHLKPIYDWFSKTLQILDPNSTLESLETILEQRDDLRKFASESLQQADTGIVAVHGENIPIEATGEVPKEIKDDMLRQLNDKGRGVLIRSSEGHRFTVYREADELVVSRLYTHHKTRQGEPVRFEIEEESEGTRRLIDLLPVFYDLQNPKTNRVYFIDELDRSMHSMLTRSLLEGYLSTCRDSTRGQLLFTTHEEQLLDQSLLRRDEIWFVNKGVDGGSYLECLADYAKVRADTDIRKAYLHGRYSGVPQIQRLPRTPQTGEPVTR